MLEIWAPIYLPGSHASADDADVSAHLLALPRLGAGIVTNVPPKACTLCRPDVASTQNSLCIFADRVGPYSKLNRPLYIRALRSLRQTWRFDWFGRREKGLKRTCYEFLGLYKGSVMVCM